MACTKITGSSHSTGRIVTIDALSHSQYLKGSQHTPIWDMQKRVAVVDIRKECLAGFGIESEHFCADNHSYPATTSEYVELDSGDLPYNAKSHARKRTSIFDNHLST
jgi:hypothetical protein